MHRCLSSLNKLSVVHTILRHCLLWRPTHVAHCPEFCFVWLVMYVQLCIITVVYENMLLAPPSPHTHTHTHTHTQTKQTVALYKQCGRIVHKKNWNAVRIIRFNCHHIDVMQLPPGLFLQQPYILYCSTQIYRDWWKDCDILLIL